MSHFAISILFDCTWIHLSSLSSKMENLALQYQLAEQVPQEEEEDEALPFVPDDVLLEVFKYLSVAELFAARRACRRWAALALQADVWRHRACSYGAEGVLGAVLRLAPCVRSLFWSSREASSLKREGRWPAGADVLAATTCCAAKALYILLVDHDPDEGQVDVDDAAVAAASILRRQESLGRLRKLTLDIEARSMSAPTRDLIRTAFTTEGLYSLTVVLASYFDFDPDCLATAARPRASLKELIYHDMMDMSWFPIFLLLVDCHADTLESLTFKSPICTNLSGLYRFEAELVASRVAGLRALHCPLLRGMGALLRCSRLESLRLQLDFGVPADVALLRDAKEYLRQATQLKKFVVNEYCASEDSSEFFRMTVDLLEALASSRRSALQVLVLGNYWDSQAADGASLGRLTDALGLLPALSEVHTSTDSGDVLLALMESLSRSASGDRPLTLRVSKSMSRFTCAHAWMHHELTNVVEILKECPSLHVRIPSFYCFPSTLYGRDCSACFSLCHQPVANRNEVLLFGHPEGAECDAPLHADKDVAGHRVAVPADEEPAPR